MSSVTSVSMFSVASSSLPKPSSVSSPKFSSVSFTSVAMPSKGRSWKLGATEGDEKSAFEKKIDEVQKAASGFNDAVKETALEVNEGVKGKADEINEINKKNLESIKEKNDEVGGFVSEKTKEGSKDAEGAWEAAKDKAEKVTEAIFGKDGDK